MEDNHERENDDRYEEIDQKEQLIGFWSAANEGEGETSGASLSLNYTRGDYSSAYRAANRRVVRSTKRARATGKNTAIAEFDLHLSREAYIRVLNEKFAALCSEASPEQIEEFLQNNPKMDIHFDEEKPFINACVNNVDEVVEYLYNRIGPDLSVNNDEPFRFTCIANKITNAQFLAEKCDRYNLSLRMRTKEDTIPIAPHPFSEFVIDEKTTTTDYNSKQSDEHDDFEMAEYLDGECECECDGEYDGECECGCEEEYVDSDVDSDAD